MLFWTNDFYGMQGILGCVCSVLSITGNKSPMPERGVEVAVFDYAQHWESLVCGETFVAGFSDKQQPGAYNSLPKFQEAFPGRVHLLPNADGALDALAAQLQVDAIYSIQVRLASTKKAAALMCRSDRPVVYCSGTAKARRIRPLDHFSRTRCSTAGPA